MNKYFLPIYHSDLKPWIKYWLFKRLEGQGESTLKAETISSGILTKVDKSKALSIKEYYGNTVQDGTPTPELPVEIQTISGDNTFNINSVNYNLDLKGINLWKFDSNNWYRNNNTNYVINSISSLSITSNNVAYANTGFKLNLENGTYTFSLGNVINSNENMTTKRMTLSTFTNGTRAVVQHIDMGTPRTVTITNAENKQYVLEFWASYSTALVNTATFTNIMINKGSTALPYESYYNYELCKIGDYQDKIYNVGGTWKIEKKVGKVVLNGSEEWSYYTATSKPVFYLLCENYGINYKQQSGLICYSNYYLGKGQVFNFDNVYNLGNNVITFRTSYTRLVIRNDNITTADDFKTWLSTHNTNVYYALATPTTETITNTNLISQLNALYEFNVNSGTVTISNNSEITLEVLLEYYGR